MAMLGGRVSWRRKDLGFLVNGSVSWVFSLFYQVICGMVNLLRFLPSFFFFLPFLWAPLLCSAPGESHGREVRQMSVGSVAHTRCYHHTHRKPPN